MERHHAARPCSPPTPPGRALFVALHDAKEAGVDPEIAIERIKNNTGITWNRDGDFFKGSLLETNRDTGIPTGKLLSSRESIDTAADQLVTVMLPHTGGH